MSDNGNKQVIDIPVIDMNYRNQKLTEARKKKEQAASLRSQISSIDTAARELEETAAVIEKIYGISKGSEEPVSDEPPKKVRRAAAKKSVYSAPEKKTRKGKVTKTEAMRLILNAVGKGFDTFSSMRDNQNIPNSTARRALEALVKSGKLKVVSKSIRGTRKYSL